MAKSISALRSAAVKFYKVFLKKEYKKQASKQSPIEHAENNPEGFRLQERYYNMQGVS